MSQFDGLCASLARTYGVDLGKVKATGWEGDPTVVTPTDVMAAAGLTWPPDPVAAEKVKKRVAEHRAAVDGAPQLVSRLNAAATPTPSNSIHPSMSRWNPTVQVRVDPFHRNPLVEDARQASGAYKIAIKEATPPTMFATGDLPIFLASGAEPSILLKVPWKARHYAATVDNKELARLLEQLAGPDGDLQAGDYWGLVEGAFEYDQRVDSWLRGDGRNPGSPVY